MRRYSFFACLLLALAVTGCRSKEKAVPMDPVDVQQLRAGGSIMQAYVQEAGKTTAKTSIYNPTDKEVASITGEMDLFDASGNLVGHQDLTYDSFIDSVTRYKGSLLPKSRGDGGIVFPFENPGQYPYYKFVIKSATYYEKGNDYKDFGHLFAAAARGDESGVEKAIDEDRGLATAKDPESQMTVLHQAAASNDLDLVKSILNEGADIEVAARGGATPLYEALSGGASDVANYLIGKGARIDGVHFQTTALQLACYNCNAEVMSALLAKGADPNEASGAAGSPLAIVALLGDVDKMKVLIQHGAKIDARDRIYGTVLHRAAASRNPAAVKLLLDNGADVNAIAAPRRPFTPLMEAAAYGDGETVKLLLDHGANKDAQGPGGQTALDYARRYGNLDTESALQAAAGK